MKVRKRLAIIFLLSIFTVIAIILTMNAIIKTKRNQEIEKKTEKFMFENEGNYGEYHIGDIEEIEGRIYVVLKYIPEGREGRLYLIEFEGENIDYVKRELPMSMGVVAYIERMAGNTIVFGAVDDKIWKDVNRPPEEVDFTEVQVTYADGKEKQTDVSNFSSFLFCIPGNQVVNDVIFFSDNETIAKYSELPVGYLEQ